jgi:hypothetical protein
MQDRRSDFQPLVRWYDEGHWKLRAERENADICITSEEACNPLPSPHKEANEIVKRELKYERAIGR